MIIYYNRVQLINHSRSSTLLNIKFKNISRCFDLYEVMIKVFIKYLFYIKSNYIILTLLLILYKKYKIFIKLGKNSKQH